MIENKKKHNQKYLWHDWILEKSTASNLSERQVTNFAIWNSKSCDYTSVASPKEKKKIKLFVLTVFYYYNF